MSSVKLSKRIMGDAQVVSKALNRSVARQIEHWAKIGKIMEENPDSTYEFIKDLLIAREEAKAGSLSSYKSIDPDCI